MMDIFNYYEYSPRLASAGQPEPGQFAGIRAAGFDLVINLLPPDSPDALAGEGDLVRGLGMDYIAIPVVWTSPTGENLRVFFAALQQNRQRKVFVHCAMNFRASAFTFLYLVLVDKAPLEPAWHSMLEIWEPYGAWPAFIEEQLQKTAGYRV